MDDRCHPDRIGDTICHTDGVRLPCYARSFRGAVINILLYTPCFSLISIGIYNIETTRANLRKMILMCSGIYAAIILVFCVGISLHHSLYIREGLYLMLALFCASVFYCIYMIIQEMIRRRNLLETMAATDMLPYVRYSRASVIILWLAVLAMPVAIQLDKATGIQKTTLTTRFLAIHLHEFIV